MQGPAPAEARRVLCMAAGMKHPGVEEYLINRKATAVLSQPRCQWKHKLKAVSQPRRPWKHRATAVSFASKEAKECRNS